MSPARPMSAYGYASVSRGYSLNDERRLRWTLLERAKHDGLLLRHVFIDHRDESPYAFTAMRALLRRRDDVQAVVLPDLNHVAHIATVTGLTRAGLTRYLGAAVLLAEPSPAASRRTTQ